MFLKKQNLEEETKGVYEEDGLVFEAEEEDRPRKDDPFVSRCMTFNLGRSLFLVCTRGKLEFRSYFCPKDAPVSIF